MNVINFLIRDSNQGEEASKTNSFNCTCLLTFGNFPKSVFWASDGCSEIKNRFKNKKFISKWLKVFFIILCTKRYFGLSNVFFCYFVITYIKYLPFCNAPFCIQKTIWNILWKHHQHFLFLVTLTWVPTLLNLLSTWEYILKLSFQL